MKNIKTKVLIIGGGAAGLNSALNLETKEAILVERNGSNSLIAPWNLMLGKKEDMKKKFLSTGNNLNDKQMLSVFLNKQNEAIEDLKKIGLKLRKSNIGVVPNYRLPGFKARQIFLKKIKGKGIKILNGNVKNFLVNEEKKSKIIGVEIETSNFKRTNIFFDYLILAAGGLSGFFPFITGSEDSNGSILSLCYEAGFKMRDLEFFMFHPFLVIDKRFPKVLISGDILTKMEYENERGEPFLSKDIAKALRNNKYHYVFPQMVREFYLQSLKRKIFGRLVCSKKWFDQFKKENEFGFVFKNFEFDEVKRIEIHPAFHFSIGGLIINKKSETNKKNIYAAGEITGGLNGSNRMGGVAILEALIFSKIAASEINKKIKNQSKEEIINLKKVKKIGKLGLPKKERDMIWESLGPIKDKEKLEKFKLYLEQKKSLTSQEKLIKKIIEICLLRRESIGSFFRKDLPQSKKAPSSFLLNRDISFKYKK